MGTSVQVMTRMIPVFELPRHCKRPGEAFMSTNHEYVYSRFVVLALTRSALLIITQQQIAFEWGPWSLVFRVRACSFVDFGMIF